MNANENQVVTYDPNDGVSEDAIRTMIVPVRGVQVMLDRDLATLYGVEVMYLNRQVKRNIERFPSNFMFQLTKEDCLRCQIATLNGKRGGRFGLGLDSASLVCYTWLRQRISESGDTWMRRNPFADGEVQASPLYF